jgi:PhnB protein
MTHGKHNEVFFMGFLFIFVRQYSKSNFMAQVNPYITFNGNCEAAFNFYRSVFGGEFNGVNKFKDMPPAEGQTISAADGEKIMHVAFPISKETVLMGSDSFGEWASQLKEGNNFTISINCESEDEATKLFNGLSAGGRITMPLEKTFWAAFFGMFTDKFGINWMVNYDYAKNS